MGGGHHRFVIPRTALVRMTAWGAILLSAGCLVDSVPEPDKRLAAGWERFAEGDFSLALADFNAVYKALPAESPRRVEALYGLAAVWHLRRPDNNPALARRLYHDVTETAPGSDWDAWSRLALARMLLTAPDAIEKDPDPAALRLAYQEVIDRFPFHEAGEQAFLFQQSARLEGSRPEEVRAVLEALEAFLATHPETPYRSAVWGLRKHCCQVLGRTEHQLEAAIQEWKTAPVDPLNPVQDQTVSYWQIATLAEFETGDWDIARDYYRKLIAEYPSDVRVFLAKQELKRMDDREARLLAELNRGEEPP